MTCSNKNCEICRLGRIRKMALRDCRSGSRKQSEKWVHMLFDWYLNESSDNDYYKGILNGSWPNAIEILERSLEKAKKYREEHPE